MPPYSEFIDRVFREPELLKRLTPPEPLDFQLVRSIREAGDAALAGDAVIRDAAAFALVRGGLLYAVDAIDAAHPVFQDVPGDLGAYWHGMVHRREGDFDNARYWFRRAGTLPFFGSLHSVASQFSADVARQPDWDPYLFTGQCEQAHFGTAELGGELARLQRAEFDVLFDYCWRRAVTSASGE